MPEPAERIVNLALFLAAARSPVSAERIRAEVYGYPGDQDEAAFLRMFERDKEELRATGLFVASTPDGTYLLDTSRSYCEEFELSAEEELALRAAGAALLDDPSFPFPSDLRRALIKIASATDSPFPVSSHVADEGPRHQGASVEALVSAAAAGKRVTYDYTNSAGRSGRHVVEPYGLFLREGRWYLVARDTAIDEVRVYAVTRMQGLSVDQARPKTRDFEVPDGFDVATFIGLPFQYGPGAPFEAVVRFHTDAAWRAEALTGGHGTRERDEGGLLWTVSVRDEEALLRWVVRHGPGIEVVHPAHLAQRLRELIAGVVEAHA